MKLSIIIPAFNEEERLPRTLEHIGTALANADCDSETMVVNNDSLDETKRIAERFGAGIIFEAVHNISRVRNTGGRHASGDVLIFVDADTLVPATLFQEIANTMKDENCFGGAVAVQWDTLERQWMKIYLLGGKFCTNVLNMKQGATQFCRKSAFERIGGYDETIFMGEDVEFYWRLSKSAKQQGGYVHFIKHPKVLTSARRFDQMTVKKALLLTNPFFIRLAWRKKSFWKDWYEDPVR
jgi:glycosyltransferase involved in cell wall biosynthesis